MIDELKLCGKVAKYWYWKKLYYAIKDELLKRYAQFDGYDQQVWTDPSWFSKEDYASHSHILERWKIGDAVFHKPTDEFEYFNYEWQVGKTSKNYYELVKTCKNKIDGRKPCSLDLEDRARAFQALKRLIKIYRSQMEFNFSGEQS